jgi:hypothetical protein
MTLVLTMSACLSQATSPEPVSAVSKQCRQASMKQSPVDLQEMVDKFVQSIPATGPPGYADPTKDPTGRNALVNGFTKDFHAPRGTLAGG